MAQDLISIIIPVYNRGWQLYRALNSIKKQTYRHYEVIICDDGSKEDIKSIVNMFSLDINIIYIYIDNSGGPARPRNIALSQASGTWISFLDSDDWWTPNRLEIMTKNLTQDVDFMYHPLRVKIQFGIWDLRRISRLKVGHLMNCQPLEYMAKNGNPIATSGVLIRKKTLVLLGGMDEDKALTGIEDFDLWLKVAEVGINFKYVNQTLGYYWIGKDSISLYSHKRISGERKLFIRHSIYFDPSYIHIAKLRYYYQVGSMLYGIKFYNHSAFLFLLKALQTPNSYKKVKIYWKLLKIIIKTKLAI